MILINSLGIQDSGGITVLEKFFEEIKDNNSYQYLIVCNRNKNILDLINKYKYIENFNFKIIDNKGFIHRLYYENIIFKKIIQKNNIELIYNFSGSAQFFLNIPQITKVQNLLFYSRNIDKTYWKKQEYMKFIKQILFKRIMFHCMLKQTNNIEIQSDHVMNYISDFIKVRDKNFYIKSDIEIEAKLFNTPKEYDFSKKIKFLYIVGPHFEYLHKNFKDFVETMIELNKLDFDFDINITLTKAQLHLSLVWDNELDSKTNFLGYISQYEMKNLFCDNTILISTSVIETLGLHVVEAVQNGILAISPNELYAKSVYGNDILTYKLFDVASLVGRIDKITLLGNNNIKDIILKNQQYLIANETKKYKNVVDIFDKILKGENVQK
jgi:hypothetical protein